MNRILTIAVFILGVMGTNAQAGEQYMFNPALFYATEETKFGSIDVNTTKLFANIGAGLILDNGFALGAKYVSIDEDAEDEDSNESKSAMTGYGVMAGYFHKSGFTVMGSYLFEPEKEMKSGNTTTKLFGGTGSVIDLAYVFGSGSYAIGPQVSIVSSTFTKSEVNGTEVDLSDDYEESFTYPYVTLFLYF